ncbi:MBL fold metallo-hydrolase [candidate division WOR-3 bacterium]|nr:MBL fold metallo-hydrolase [candidate division WOR-3 bacterium]
MKLGNFELHVLSDGFFGLDGGAMFGVVPRPLWERTNPPDDRNRIRLALRPLLILAGDRRVLVDTGIGDKWDAKGRDVYRIEKTDTVDASLARLSLTPGDVTDVVLTHLHFDHAGGATRLGPSGYPAPSFPSAQYVVQRAEWEDATQPNRRSRAAYLPENFMPLEQAGQLRLVDGTQELLPGVELLHTGGHTRGLQLVRVRSTGSTAVFWSDLIPTRAHVAAPYIMGYDLFPLVTMEAKERLVNDASAGRWLCLLEHDPDAAAGYLAGRDGRYTFEPAPAI